MEILKVVGKLLFEGMGLLIDSRGTDLRSQDRAYNNVEKRAMNEGKTLSDDYYQKRGKLNEAMNAHAEIKNVYDTIKKENRW